MLQAGAALLLAGGPMLALGQAVRPPRLQPILRVPDASIPLELARVRIESQVVGFAVQTRIELEIANPNPQDLEGELNFPLQPGQTVTGFALDIDGELRPAVPVEKSKGRQVFEDVIRARVDPALLESTGGSHHKLRVYPLPGRGSRRVVLEVAETLAPRPRGGQALLQIPLQFGMRVRELDVAVHVPPSGRSAAPLGRLGPDELPVERRPDGSSWVRLQRRGYTGTGTLEVALRQNTHAPKLVTQSFRDATYFYAEVPLVAGDRPLPAPRRVALLWDASGSAAQRERGRELDVLDAFFGLVPAVEVDLVVVRDVAEAPRRFSIAGGDWHALREHLGALAYDGASALDRMVVPAGADLALLFSDGLGTWGEGGLPPSPVPLHAFTSGPATDITLLRHAAEHSGGMVIDLARTSARDAAAQVRRERARLLDAHGPGLEEIVFESRYPQEGRLVLAGRLRGPAGPLTLRLQSADGSVAQQTLQLPQPAAPASATLPVAAYRWATFRLAGLEADRDRHQQAIRRLGLHFGLVTSGTSLIVLDRVEDYARHGIEPPAPLMAQYQQLLAQRARRTGTEREAHLDRVARRFAEKQAWWERDFPKDAPPPPREEAVARREAAAAAERQASESRTARPMAAPAPVARLMAPAPAPAAAPAPPRPASAGGPLDATIALKRWTPDSPYARRLRAVPADAMYEAYLDERPGHANSTAFFLDAADIFLERGRPELAVRILSNLAEMALENRHVLRLLAYRLQQAGHTGLAIPQLRKVLALSPDEPQSHRDLGLALAQHGQPQAAVDRLWELVARPWNERFPEIELIALAELNAIVAKARAADPRALDTSAIDPRLLRNLPLDLRAVLSWDADNTDIDLHVIDPDGEVAHYGHRLTRQGGRMSSDFTGGYGPEEFSLRHAKPGTYTVKADFFGHRQQVVAPSTTLMLRLSTGFGTPAQKDVDAVVRLTGEARQVTVGTFTVGSPQ